MSTTYQQIKKKSPVPVSGREKTVGTQARPMRGADPAGGGMGFASFTRSPGVLRTLIYVVEPDGIRNHRAARQTRAMTFFLRCCIMLRSARF